jgi:hypothetical protein
LILEAYARLEHAQAADLVTIRGPEFVDRGSCTSAPATTTTSVRAVQPS